MTLAFALVDLVVAPRSESHPALFMVTWPHICRTPTKNHLHLHPRILLPLIITEREAGKFISEILDKTYPSPVSFST